MEPIRVLPKTVPAEVYNHVRLALLRFKAPIQFELREHRGLAISLERFYWHCVETYSSGRTIMVWSQFDLEERCAIHAPVKCELSIYHIQAGLVMGSVLDELSDIVALRLQEQAGDEHILQNLVLD